MRPGVSDQRCIVIRHKCHVVIPPQSSDDAGHGEGIELHPIDLPRAQRGAKTEQQERKRRATH